MAVVLTAAVLVSSMFHRPDPAAPATTRPAAGGPPTSGRPAVGGGLAAAGQVGWRAIGGTRVERSPATAGRPETAGFTGNGRADQGMALAAVRRCARGTTYAATVRLRASRPATLVEVTLLELVGGRRFAADSVGAVLVDRSWRRVQVAHQAHRLGSALALEVVLPRGSSPATVQVDDLQVVAERP